MSKDQYWVIAAIGAFALFLKNIDDIFKNIGLFSDNAIALFLIQEMWIEIIAAVCILYLISRSNIHDVLTHINQEAIRECPKFYFRIFQFKVSFALFIVFGIAIALMIGIFCYQTKKIMYSYNNFSVNYIEEALCQGEYEAAEKRAILLSSSIIGNNRRIFYSNLSRKIGNLIKIRQKYIDRNIDYSNLHQAVIAENVRSAAYLFGRSITDVHAILEFAPEINCH